MRLHPILHPLVGDQAMPRKPKKPEKPYPDFPLFPHASGQWAKKIRGKLHYFGTDPHAALNKYLQERPEIQAGQSPRLHPTTPAVTVRDLVNRFLSAKKSILDSGELSPRTWRDYYATCETLLKLFGRARPVADLAGDDFERLRADLAKRRGAVSLGNEIQRVRTLFKFAFDEGILEKSVRFGAGFKKPKRKAIRAARHAAGSRMIEAADLRKLLAAAGTPMKGMILLGLNCGFGQTDVANLPLKAIDLAGAWIDFPRPKTEIGRRCPLWPETVKALREAIDDRPGAKAETDAGLAFITKYGARWVRVRERKEKAAVPIDSINLEFTKLLTALSLKRKGLAFYALRHIFRTIADGSKDQPAIDHIMGHAREDMASLYRERIDDSRLEAVVKVVRDWLWPKPKKAGKAERKRIS